MWCLKKCTHRYVWLNSVSDNDADVRDNRSTTDSKMELYFLFYIFEHENKNNYRVLLLQFYLKTLKMKTNNSSVADS